jgi:hypothetical protein
LNKPVEHLLACAAFDVVGEPVDLAAGVFDGVGQDRVLGRGQLGGGHVAAPSMVVDGDDVMNALFGSEAKRFLLAMCATPGASFGVIDQLVDHRP